MERLWAPWRLEYVQNADKQDGCFFCVAAESDDDEGQLVVHRGERAFVLLNKFPYASGHLLVAPCDRADAVDRREHVRCPCGVVGGQPEAPRSALQSFGSTRSLCKITVYCGLFAAIRAFGEAPAAAFLPCHGASIIWAKRELAPSGSDR